MKAARRVRLRNPPVRNFLIPKRKTRTRQHVLWEPEWTPEIAIWTHNFIRKNQWRAQAWYDHEDLMQEAHIVFMRVRDKYPHVVEAPLFMKMYQTALWRHIMDSGRKLKKDILATRKAMEEVKLFMPHMVDFNNGPLNIALAEGPPELRLLMEFMNNDSNLEKLRAPQRNRVSAKPRQNIDQRLSSLLGIPYFPFRESLRKWLFAA